MSTSQKYYAITSAARLSSSREGDSGGHPDSPDTLSSLQVRIINEAIRLIDDEGLENFSLRRLAAGLQQSPMSTYRHFGSRDQLLICAADQILKTIEVPPPSVGDWPERLVHLGLNVWDTVVAHPWVELVGVREMRPPQKAATRIVYRWMSDAGLERDTATDAITLFWAVVTGYIKAPFYVGEADAAARNRRAVEFGLRLIIDGIVALCPTNPAPQRSGEHG